MLDKNNPLLCDPVSGFCEIPAEQEDVSNPVRIASAQKFVRIIYFTDPICSSCWGIEPVLRKIKLAYGDWVEIEYYMGGLLPDWSYNSGGISKPSDVASHWDEVSKIYNMPIDGDVWLEDPLPSSYPPSIAFKAAQMQDKSKAIAFLRAIREMVFLEKKNITRWDHLAQAASRVGLDVVKLKDDYKNGANVLFQSDLDLAKAMGVRGFPSLFVIDLAGNQEFIYGVKPYQILENSIVKQYPNARAIDYDRHWESLFEKYPTLTTREFAELSDLPTAQSQDLLKELSNQNKLTEYVTKNGSLWQKPMA
ncbi:DsbA family protein [Spirosoma validum]|uniref:DsbA family protein n=1 Tax=Spirosoma validum TaxID=2771355 RepID=A0A927B2K8_9BACT|nr:DsbA family protein [Spirosoma validum]MBD2754214.1 DsbA family protein [Spirosoma validum]